MRINIYRDLMYIIQQKNQVKQTTNTPYLIETLQDLSSHAKAMLGSLILLTMKHGVAKPSTALLQRYGAGCRDTQLIARKQLLEAGLLERVLKRVKKGTKKNQTNVYFVAQWLFDESLAFVIRSFCNIPWYAPIRNVQLWSQPSTSKTSSSKEVDSILKEFNLLNPDSSSSLTLSSYQSLSGSSSSLSLKQSIAKVFRGNAPSNSLYPAHAPKAEGYTRNYWGFINKTGNMATKNEELRTFKGEEHKSICECKPIFVATETERKELVAARIALRDMLPRAKSQQAAVGMPMSAEKEKAFILRQISILTPEEIEVLQNEGLV